MKMLAILALASGVMFSVVYAQSLLQWKKIPVAFPYVKQGDLASINGVMYHGGSNSEYYDHSSTDNGTTWQLNYKVKVLPYLTSEAGTIIKWGQTQRSRDNGSTWENIVRLLSDTIYLNDLVRSKNTLFASGYDYSKQKYNGCYRSNDDGDTWEKFIIDSLYFTNPRFILGDSCYVFALSSGGLFRSDDWGEHWNCVNRDIPNDSINTYKFISIAEELNTSLLFDPTKKVLILTCIDGSTMTSFDAGKAWSSRKVVNNSFNSPNYIDYQWVGSTLFAAPTYGSSTMYRSKDFGLTWQLLPVSGNSIISGITYNGKALATWCNYQIFLSEDSGATWRASLWRDDTVPRYITSIGKHIISGFNSGTYHSEDNGETWNRIYQQSSFCGTDRETLLLLSNSTILRSTDNGGSWVIIPPPQTQYNFTMGVLTKDSIMLVSTATGDLYHTTNLGLSWSKLYSPSYIRCFYASSDSLYVGSYSRVYKSVNGATWNFPDSGIVSNDIVSLCKTDKFLFAGSARKQGQDSLLCGIYRSSNNGRTWSNLNNSIQYLNINALFSNNTALYAGTNRGLYRSEDNGLTWTAESLGLNDSNVVSLCKSGHTLVISTTKSIYSAALAPVSEVNEDKIQISDNSVCLVTGQDEFVIPVLLSDGVYKTNVYSLTGEAVHSDDAVVRNNTLNLRLRNLPSGMYAVVIQTTSALLRRLIIQP